MDPQNFLNGLALFDLLNVDEIATLQHILEFAREPNNNIMEYSKITNFIIQKLYKESSVYHKRFKFFLGYYEELLSMHYIWDSLGKTFNL